MTTTIIYKKSLLKKGRKICLLALSLCDFLFQILIKIVYYKWPSEKLCCIFIALAGLLYIAFFFNLLLILIDRYVSISIYGITEKWRFDSSFFGSFSSIWFSSLLSNVQRLSTYIQTLNFDFLFNYYYDTLFSNYFRYIALELCVASLQDYVENRYNGLAIDGTTNYTHDFIYFY